MTGALLLLLLAAAPAEGIDALVVCPTEFREALAPWLTHRRLQGHRIALAAPRGSAAATRELIVDAAQRSGSLRYVLLVGDAEPSSKSASALRTLCVPTHRAPARVNVRYGSEPQIASDNAYADLDGDMAPDLAIGRITADSAADLAVVVKKILAYERRGNQGAWQSRINVVAGVGGFGALIDTLVESAAKRFLCDGIPSSYRTSMTYASWRSPFCPDPRRFHETAVERMNEGCLFWVYIGHGQRRVLDRVHTPAGVYPILDTEHMPRLQCASGAPIALMLSCYTGAFDGRRDCLAEEMLRTEGGPVAVLCSTRVTMPYGMAVLSDGLMRECFSSRGQTLGEMMLHAKRRALRAESIAAEQDAAESGESVWLDAVAAAMGGDKESLAQERAEHVLMFHLLGDPLLRIARPEQLEMTADNTIDAGETLLIRGRSPRAAEGSLELVCRRDAFTFTPPRRRTLGGDTKRLAAFDQVYRQANDRRWSTQRVKLSKGEFQLRLNIPHEARGACYVRLTVRDDEAMQVGAAKVFVRPSVSEK